MSSYLTFYGRLNPKWYKVERLEKSDYIKQPDVLSIMCFSRSSAMYREVYEELNPAYCGDKEVFTTVTRQDLENVASSINESIKRIQESIESDKRNRSEYISYLKDQNQVLSFSEFIEKLDGTDYSREYQEELEELESCKSYLCFLIHFIDECEYNTCSFCELLCNID